jgi:hypothetical protein
MAWRTPKPEAQFRVSLRPQQRTCPQCGSPLWIAYNTRRKVVTLEGIFQLRIAISQCHTSTCPRYHVRSHPEEEGRWALPHGEFGLDVIAQYLSAPAPTAWAKCARAMEKTSTLTVGRSSQ